MTSSVHVHRNPIAGCPLGLGCCGGTIFGPPPLFKDSPCPCEIWSSCLLAIPEQLGRVQVEQPHADFVISHFKTLLEPLSVIEASTSWVDGVALAWLRGAWGWAQRRAVARDVAVPPAPGRMRFVSLRELGRIRQEECSNDYDRERGSRLHEIATVPSLIVVPLMGGDGWAASALVELLDIRLSASGRSTWLVEDPAKPFAKGCNAWSEEFADILSRRCAPRLRPVATSAPLPYPRV